MKITRLITSTVAAATIACLATFQSTATAAEAKKKVVCGQKTVEVLAKAMGEKGTIAILAGNQSAPNLQNRVAGAKEELAKYPNMKLNNPGVFYHVETPEKAAEAVQNAQNANPGIQGWAMIGG
jgi:ribose transport system substrate-binding protein